VIVAILGIAHGDARHCRTRAAIAALLLPQ
jgi:hypothetical protein